MVALNKGANIVSYDWVEESVKAKKLQDPEDYICEDKNLEKKYKFKLAGSLLKAKNKKLGILEGYKVYCPINIKPSIDEIKMLIEQCGG